MSNLISHISILNAGRSVIEKENNPEGVYELHVNLSFQPDDVWKSRFFCEWKKLYLRKRRKIVISGNELILVLTRLDNIQECIDYVRQLIQKVCSLLSINGGIGERISGTVREHRREIKTKRFRISRLF